MAHDGCGSKNAFEVMMEAQRTLQFVTQVQQQQEFEKKWTEAWSQAQELLAEESDYDDIDSVAFEIEDLAAMVIDIPIETVQSPKVGNAKHREQLRELQQVVADVEKAMQDAMNECRCPKSLRYLLHDMI